MIFANSTLKKQFFLIYQCHTYQPFKIGMLGTFWYSYFQANCWQLCNMSDTHTYRDVLHLQSIAGLNQQILCFYHLTKASLKRSLIHNKVIQNNVLKNKEPTFYIHIYATKITPVSYRQRLPFCYSPEPLSNSKYLAICQQFGLQWL